MPSRSICSRSAIQGVCGVLAGQRGLIAQYAADYPEINYLVKMNSKTNLVKATKQEDPVLPAAVRSGRRACHARGNGVNIVGLGYTIYLGSEYESTMMAEAGELIAAGPCQRPASSCCGSTRAARPSPLRRIPDLIAGAAGVALCLGADFVKVNPPKPEDGTHAGRGPEGRLHGRRPHAAWCAPAAPPLTPRRSSPSCTTRFTWAAPTATPPAATSTSARLDEAVRLTKAISAITLADYAVADALAVFNGEADFAWED